MQEPMLRTLNRVLGFLRSFEKPLKFAPLMSEESMIKSPYLIEVLSSKLGLKAWRY